MATMINITPDTDGEFTVSVPGVFSRLSGRAPIGAAAVEIEEVVVPAVTVTPQSDPAFYYDEDGGFDAAAAPKTIPEHRYFRFTGRADVPGVVVGVD